MVNYNETQQHACDESDRKDKHDDIKTNICIQLLVTLHVIKI